MSIIQDFLLAEPGEEDFTVAELNALARMKAWYSSRDLCEANSHVEQITTTVTRGNVYGGEPVVTELHTLVPAPITDAPGIPEINRIEFLRYLYEHGLIDDEVQT